MIEPAVAPATTLRRALTDFGPAYAVNGLIGFIFASTGPVAVILSVGYARRAVASPTSRRGSSARSSSTAWSRCCSAGATGSRWCFFWTIPGTVLVGPALGHLSFAEVIGAFVASGAADGAARR